MTRELFPVKNDGSNFPATQSDVYTGINKVLEMAGLSPNGNNDAIGGQSAEYLLRLLTSRGAKFDNLTNISTPNTIILNSISPEIPFTSLSIGSIFIFKANYNNTSTCSINIDSIGPISLKDYIGADLIANFLEANKYYQIIYNGTEFRIIQRPLQNATNTLSGITLQNQQILLSNNVSDPNNNIDFSEGTFVFSDFSGNAYLSEITKKLDENWVAGTNQGGLDTGLKANSTWYYCYAIYNSTSGIIDVIFSVNNTTPTLPSGFTKYKYIGACSTDISSNIVKFSHRKDNYFEYNIPIESFSSSSISFTRVPVTIDAPPNTRVRMNCLASNSRTPGTGYYGVIFSQLSLPEHTLQKLRSNISWAQQETFDFMVDENSQFGIRRADPTYSQSLDITTEGYFDLNI